MLSQKLLALPGEKLVSPLSSFSTVFASLFFHVSPTPTKTPPFLNNPSTLGGLGQTAL